MTLRQYLILMSVGTALCWLSWVVVVLNINPDEASLLSLMFFYLSLALAVVGAFSVLGFIIRRAIIKNDELVFRHVKKTFRQGLFISIFIIVGLLLLAEHLLTWWNFILLALLFVFLEAIVFTGRKFHNVDYVK